MWVESLSAGMKWDRERDTPRIRQAFVTLANTRTTWPAPFHFREALPKIEVRALGYEVKPSSPERVSQVMAEVELLVRTAPEPRVRKSHLPPDAKARIEAELRQHYGSAQP